MRAMDTYRRWEKFLQDFTYKPNWRFTAVEGGIYPGIYIQMRVPNSRRDVFNPNDTVLISKTVNVPDSWVSEEFALDYLKSCIGHLEDHEIDEWIRYKGELVFDPHEGQ